MISMLGMIDQVFTTHKVKCINYGESDYNDDGDWVNGQTEEFAANVNIQPMNGNDAQFLSGLGGTVQPQRTFTLFLNNGKQIYHERESDSGAIQASDVIATMYGKERKFRVLFADNRPHHNYCKAYIVMKELGE